AIEGPHGDTHYVELTADGALLVTAGNDGQVLAWPVAGGAVAPQSLRVVAKHTGAVTALAVERDWIASAGRDATISRARRAGDDVRATHRPSLTGMMPAHARGDRASARGGDLRRRAGGVRGLWPPARDRTRRRRARARSRRDGMVRRGDRARAWRRRGCGREA